MPVVVIIGAQWGDEGKGKVVDMWAETADAVMRFAGGPNAGHTLVVGDDKVILRLVPSGALHDHTQCILGSGMVVNPDVLVEEMNALAERGVNLDGRLHLSEHAHLIMPYHVAVDELRENAEGGTKIGTTKRGIGPCYEDKVGRRGVRAGDLRDVAHARERVAEALAAWSPTIAALGGSTPELDLACRCLTTQAARLAPLLADTSLLAAQLVSSGKRVLLEGAQGTLLDVDHGTYPFVTSSSSTAGGACSGSGIGPTRIDRVIGITKAYTTRVGGGPFPTELRDEIGASLRNTGAEYGSVTGRPRRTGWLDLVALRYAARVNGLDGLALTKLDVLSALDEIAVCVAYRTPEGLRETPPVAALGSCTPVYQTLPGWRQDITACRTMEALPAAARDYLRFIEDRSGLPLFLVSVGPRRDQTIVLRDPFP